MRVIGHVPKVFPCVCCKFRIEMWIVRCIAVGKSHFRGGLRLTFAYFDIVSCQGSHSHKAASFPDAFSQMMSDLNYIIIPVFLRDATKSCLNSGCQFSTFCVSKVKLVPVAEPDEEGSRCEIRRCRTSWLSLRSGSRRNSAAQNFKTTV